MRAVRRGLCRCRRHLFSNAVCFLFVTIIRTADSERTGHGTPAPILLNRVRQFMRHQPLSLAGMG
jgi:hypothetical protein